LITEHNTARVIKGLELHLIISSVAGIGGLGRSLNVRRRLCFLCRDKYCSLNVRRLQSTHFWHTPDNRLPRSRFAPIRLKIFIHMDNRITIRLNPAPQTGLSNIRYNGTHARAGPEQEVDGAAATGSRCSALSVFQCKYVLPSTHRLGVPCRRRHVKS